MVFDFPLTEVRVRPHQVTALHLMVALAMCGTGAVLMQFYPPAGNWSFILVIAGAILLMVSMFRNKWIRDAKVNRLLRIAELMILLCLASYLAIEGMLTPAAIMGVLSATVLLALIWEQQKPGTLFVRIDDTGVKMPLASRRRQISWWEIDQALFRHGVLTFNCHDNRLYQWTIGPLEIDKQAFEDFCNKKIEEEKPKRAQNVW